MLTRWLYKTSDIRDEMNRLNQEMEHLFSGRSPLSGGSSVFPPFNIYDNGENIVVTAEITGIDPKELDISATINTLAVKGERKAPLVDEKASFHRQERGFGKFSHSITLPQDIAPEKVKADYKLGVITLTLPKAEETKPRKIEINV